MRVVGSKVKLWMVGAGVAVAVLAACVPIVHWVTPKGQPLTDARCEDHVPSKDGGPDVCNFRTTKDTPKDAASCEADGGYLQSSVFAMNDPPLCVFPNADDGKHCTKSTDCEGTCDAKTRTCRDSKLWQPYLDEQGNETPGMVE